jgi:serine/threonine protein kinase
VFPETHGMDVARHRAAIDPILEDEQTIDNYRLGKTVGRGNFAKVKVASHTLTGAEVAIKIVDKTTLNASSMAKVRR